MYTLDSPLMAPAVVTAAQIDRWFHRHNPDAPPLGEAIMEAAQYGLDPAIVAAQVDEETGHYTSTRATRDHNPAGIGVTSDDAPGNTFASDADGIHAQIAHLLTYVRGAANPLAGEDPRYDAAKSAGKLGTVRVIGDLGGGNWAADPDYAPKLVDRVNDLCDNPGEISGTGNGGTMTADAQIKLLVPTVDQQLRNNGHAFLGRRGMTPVAIVNHVTDGDTLAGALDWNRRADIEASAHFYIDRDGTIVQDVSLDNGAWSNGILDHPSLPPQLRDAIADGSNPNLYTVSIEHVGHPMDDGFPTPAQLTATAQLQAALLTIYDLPADREHIIGHFQFDDVSRHNCPGPRFDLDALVARIQEARHGQTGSGVSAGGTTPGDVAGVEQSVVPAGGAGGAVGGAAGGDSGAGAGGAGQSGGHGHAAPEQSGRSSDRYTYFPATRHGIGHGFRDEYFRGRSIPGGDGTEGDVNPEIGYPITEEFGVSTPIVHGGAPTIIQLFERARYEWIVDDAETGAGHVELGALGYEDAQRLMSLGVMIPALYQRGT